MSPRDVKVPVGEVVITARMSDDSSELDPSRVFFEFDGVNQSKAVELRMDSPRAGWLSYRTPEALPPGRHRVVLEVVNARGQSDYEAWGFWVKPDAVRDVGLLFPDEGANLSEAQVRIGVRPVSNGPMSREVTIQGQPTRSSNYADGGLHYYADVTLKPGTNRIEVVATFVDGTSARRVFRLKRVEAALPSAPSG